MQQTKFSPAPERPQSPAGNETPAQQLGQLVLGYGDKVSIKVFNQEKTKTSLVIDSSGVAILPLIGDVVIHGRDIQSLRQELTSRYSRYFKEPQVIIRVDSMVSRKYAVLGEVLQTGSFPITMPTTLSDAIAKAGGIGNDGQADSVLLVRRGKTSGIVTKIDMESIIEKGDFALDVLVHNGDIIYVPQNNLAITADFMGKIGIILEPVLSLQRAITLWPAMVDALGSEKIGTNTNVIIGN